VTRRFGLWVPGWVGAESARLSRGITFSAAAAQAVVGETGLLCRADKGERGVGKGREGCWIEETVKTEGAGAPDMWLLATVSEAVEAGVG
jgi:hypothetical protein